MGHDDSSVRSIMACAAWDIFAWSSTNEAVCCSPLGSHALPHVSLHRDKSHPGKMKQILELSHCLWIFSHVIFPISYFSFHFLHFIKVKGARCNS